MLSCFGGLIFLLGFSYSGLLSLPFGLCRFFNFHFLWSFVSSLFDILFLLLWCLTIYPTEVLKGGSAFGLLFFRLGVSYH